jgi:hypothetical protein
MRSRPTPRPLLAAVLLLGLAVSPARAAEPTRLETQVTDQVDAFGGRDGEVEQAVSRLLDEHGIQLWVLFVDTTADLTADQFVDATWDASGLGTNDALFLVAVEDQTYQLEVDRDSLDEVTDDELDSLIADGIEPRLRAGDFAGSAAAAADGLGEAVASSGGTPGGGGTSAGGGPSGAFWGFLLVLGGAGLIAWWFMRRRQAAAAAEERDRRTGQLAREANALLIATDERVRDAGQELGFVEAEYGDEEVGPLRVAIEQARAELAKAFAVRQRLDDAEPETPGERAAMLAEIVERSKRAQAALDEQTERIQRLRDFERDAPAILASLGQRIGAAEARLPAAETAMEALRRYAPSASASVAGNVAEARKGLTGARESISRGTAALGGDNRRDAALAARTAESGLTGATALLDAVEKLAASAREAEAALAPELDAAEADIAEALRAIAGGQRSARIDQAVTAAEAELRTATAAASARPLDPIEALRRATAAHRLADNLLAGARQDAEQRARFVAALDSTIASARAHIDRAEDFVVGRRGGIGRTARTRLAEAQRQLEEAVALRGTDPRQAMEAAQRAERLADEAYQSAGSDFDSWNRGGPSWGGQGGGDQMGAILGGLLTGILLGGGRGGGGWGGSPWGSSGPSIRLPRGGGGWGGGGGGWLGGWGGGGGGGGRSRGGRW